MYKQSSFHILSKIHFNLHTTSGKEDYQATLKGHHKNIAQCETANTGKAVLTDKMIDGITLEQRQNNIHQ